MTRTFTSGHAELLDAYLTFKRSLGVFNQEERDKKIKEIPH